MPKYEIELTACFDDDECGRLVDTGTHSVIVEAPSMNHARLASQRMLGTELYASEYVTGIVSVTLVEDQ